jgi:polyphenol oxidase
VIEPPVDDIVCVPEFPVTHGFSTTRLGSCGLSGAADPAAVMERRQRMARSLDFDLGRALLAVQVHGAEVRVFHRTDGTPSGQSVLDTDGLATDVSGQALLTYHADCYPVLLLDRARGAVGSAHAGWRGTLEGIGFAIVRATRDAYGSRPDELQALIGPGICGRCYEVGPEVADAFRARYADAERFLRPAGARSLLDLRAAIRLQLEACGLPVAQIGDEESCTREDMRWFSHRGRRPGRFLAAIVAP